VNALLDTNILAELVKPNGNPAVHAALAEIPASNVFLSVITLGEIVKGIALLAPGPKRTHLARWLAGIERDYGERVLPLDIETARIWGELTARAQRKGIAIPPADGLLAATALRHGLHVMTRNTKHFEASGALVIDPWQEADSPGQGE
jgi:predicted nucleic acid-binding protein